MRVVRRLLHRLNIPHLNLGIHLIVGHPIQSISILCNVFRLIFHHGPLIFLTIFLLALEHSLTPDRSAKLSVSLVKSEKDSFMLRA